MSWQQRIQPPLQFEPQRNHGLSTQTQGLKTQHETHQPDATASFMVI
jgi:hypothetical protein